MKDPIKHDLEPNLDSEMIEDNPTILEFPLGKSEENLVEHLEWNTLQIIKLVSNLKDSTSNPCHRLVVSLLKAMMINVDIVTS